jgi:hypothetical protein
VTLDTGVPEAIRSLVNMGKTTRAATLELPGRSTRWPGGVTPGQRRRQQCRRRESGLQGDCGSLECGGTRPYFAAKTDLDRYAAERKLELQVTEQVPDREPEKAASVFRLRLPWLG